MNEITRHTTSDGTVYLHTHLGADAREIAEALRPFIGRPVRFHPENDYGHVNMLQSTYGWIMAVDGTDVIVHLPRTNYTGTVDAGKGFAWTATRIDPPRPEPRYAAAFFAVRRDYDPAHVVALTRLSMHDGVPFCDDCSGFHRTGEPHTLDAEQV